MLHVLNKLMSECVSACEIRDVSKGGVIGSGGDYISSVLNNETSHTNVSSLYTSLSNNNSTVTAQHQDTQLEPSQVPEEPRQATDMGVSTHASAGGTGLGPPGVSPLTRLSSSICTC